MFKYLKQILLVILAIFWIFLYLYLRLYVPRPQYSLIDIKVYVTLKYLLLHISFAFFHIILIFLAIYVLFFKENNRNNTLVKKISNVINFLLLKPLKQLKDLVAPHIPYSGVIFCNLATFLGKHHYEVLTKLMVCLLNFTPRIIVSLIFFIEMIFYNRIHYFIPSLLLLFIPLFFNIFIDLFIDFSVRALEDIPKYVAVIPIGEAEKNGYHIKYSFKPLKKFEYNPGDIQEYASLWYLAINIHGFGESYCRTFQKNFTPYITLFCSSLYLFATIYKILFLYVF